MLVVNNIGKMDKLQYYPGIKVCKGSGKLKSLQEEIKFDFSLVFYPHTIRIFSDYSVGLYAKLNDWSFYGILEDGQGIVSSSVLILFSGTHKGICLMPKKEFIIGDFNEKQISSVKFPLIGYYGENAEFEYENCVYKLYGAKEYADQQEMLGKIWEIQLEGFILEIENSNLNSEEYIERALAITNLLSLAIGNDIGFNRRIYNYSDGSSCEIWREMHLDDFGVYECIPPFRISCYLKQCFPIWYKQISEVEKKTICVAVNYINSTSKGYLEERVLRIAQAWELVSTDWIGDIDGLPKQIEILRERLKGVLKVWRNEFPEVDNTGFLTGRVLDSLSWDKSIAKAEKLALKQQINLETIKLDLRMLFDDRNSVAHSGRFKNYDEDRVPIINSAVFGLQLILLRRLNYTDIIHSAENGYTTYKNINEFLIS